MKSRRGVTDGGERDTVVAGVIAPGNGIAERDDRVRLDRGRWAAQADGRCGASREGEMSRNPEDAVTDDQDDEHEDKRNGKPTSRVWILPRRRADNDASGTAGTFYSIRRIVCMTLGGTATRRPVDQWGSWSSGDHALSVSRPSGSIDRTSHPLSLITPSHILSIP